MVGLALFFLALAVAAAVFGFSGIGGAATSIAQLLSFLFLVLFIVTLLFGRRIMTRVNRGTRK